MSIVTKIQWCDSTCNPTMGCAGCELWNPKTGEWSCYAGVLHLRFGGVTKGYSPTFEELTCWPGRMAEAARWLDLTVFCLSRIWRELDMAIQQSQEGEGARLAATLNRVFDGDKWKKICADDADARAEQCADLFREITGARWGTHIRMLDHERIRYFLLHLTKHDDGRDLMKKCIWKACPDGGYYASKSDNPRQRLLIQPEPNLSPLREWVTEKLTAAPKRWQDLTEDLREELWLSKHLNEVIRDMRKQGEIESYGFTGKFAETNNPLLRLNDRQKQDQPKQLELF